MNEILFFTQLLVLLAFLAIAMRSGERALICLVAFSGVFANLFVLKQVVLFGLHVTCSDVFAVGGVLGLNLIQELYGRGAAREAIRASLFTLILFACMAELHLLFIPSPFDHVHGAYASILSSTPRIVFASIGVYYLVQRVDILFFAFLKKCSIPFGARVFTSLLITQAADTALFSFFGLYGLVESLLDIMVVSFSIKCVLILILSPLATLLKKITKQEEAF